MTKDCIRERVLILEHMWEHNYNKKVCSILLRELNRDITFFLHEKLDPELEERLNKLDEEINHK